MTLRQFEQHAQRKAAIVTKDDSRIFNFFHVLVMLIVRSGLLEKFIDYLTGTMPIRKEESNEED